MGRRPVRERYFVNEAGEKDGLYQRYYANGQPAQTCTFRKGEKDGVQVSRYENGRIASESTFKRGTQDGAYVSYYPDGKIHQTCNFVNGLYEGECRLFNPDGSLISLYSYHNGKKEGLCEIYTYGEGGKAVCTERFIYEADKCVRSERLEGNAPANAIQVSVQIQKSEKLVCPDVAENAFAKPIEADVRCVLADEILGARQNRDSSEAVQISKNFRTEKNDLVRRTALKLNDHHQKCRS